MGYGMEAPQQARVNCKAAMGGAEVPQWRRAVSPCPKAESRGPSKCAQVSGDCQCAVGARHCPRTFHFLPDASPAQI
jgi:hypothetical protein